MVSRRNRHALLLASVTLGGVIAACSDTDPDGRPEFNPAAPNLPKPNTNDGVTSVDGGALAERSAHCPPVKSGDAIPLRSTAGQGNATARYEDLRLKLVSACRACHLFPTASGGFTFLDAYAGGERFVDGTRTFIPGLYDAAPRIANVLTIGKMPPEPQSPAARGGYRELGDTVAAWQRAGRPNGEFDIAPAGVGGPLRATAETRNGLTNLGDCLPDRLGTDAKADATFSALEIAPATLSQTDLASFDAFVLAGRGTGG